MFLPGKKETTDETAHRDVFFHPESSSPEQARLQQEKGFFIRG
jgi:hypothetical protein